MSENLAKIGVIGLAVMGKNLARNFASKHIKTSVYNRSYERTEELINEHGSDLLIGNKTLEAFVQSLEKPRKIIILVKAGEAVDAVIESLLPLVDEGDIIMDMGNSLYKDTERRFQELGAKNINFFGCGLSGGEEGALHGPSLMPGGPKATWEELKPLLEPISARDFQGGACVTYLGPGSAGHYVKMSHNGIEYAIVQQIAETYKIMQSALGMSLDDISSTFAKWNQGPLQSYLIGLSSIVATRKDEQSGEPLVEKILDKAGQKGTGAWTAIEGIDRAVALPSIATAVTSRVNSSNKEKRIELSKLYTQPSASALNPDDLLPSLEQALIAASIISFAQGINLIQQASAKNNWGTNLSETVRIWQGGCIIRTKLLESMQADFKEGGSDAKHVFELPSIIEKLQQSIPGLVKVTAAATTSGIAAPGYASALNYFYELTQERGSANFIQGLRDAWGAHTYERIDQKGTFHTEWDANSKPSAS